MQSTPFLRVRSSTVAPQAWCLQDAKAQFSALVDNALRGVPQHVTRRGKQAVVVLSEQDFEALKRGAANRAAPPVSFIAHLLAMPTEPSAASGGASRRATQKALPKTPGKARSKSPARKTAGDLENTERLDLQPREIDWS